MRLFIAVERNNNDYSGFWGIVQEWISKRSAFLHSQMEVLLRAIEPFNMSLGFCYYNLLLLPSRFVPPPLWGSYYIILYDALTTTEPDSPWHHHKIYLDNFNLKKVQSISVVVKTTATTDTHAATGGAAASLTVVPFQAEWPTSRLRVRTISKKLEPM